MEMVSQTCNFTFKVKRCEPELIVPAKPTPHEVKKLSDIDNQKGLRKHTYAVWFYKKGSSPSMEGKDPVKVIREAIGKALVFYYPLAGRLKEDSNGKLMVDCNGKGILFIEADADIELEQLGHTILPPFPFLQEVLYAVPGTENVVDCPLWLIQVTRLRCGGFIVATRHNHTMVDAFGVAQFMNAVGKMARGEQWPSVLPVWHRELLNARNPPRVTHIHHEYQREINDAKLDIDLTNLSHVSFLFGPDQIKAIRKQLPPHLANSCSRFELITACIWKCRTLALNLDPEEVVQITCAFNGRGKGFALNLPVGYYGNAVDFLTAISKAGVLCKNPLGYALELLKKSRSDMNEEHIRSVTDFIVTKQPRGYKLKGNFIVSDLSKVGFPEVDFGWGCAEFAGHPGSFPVVAHYMHHSCDNGDGFIVPMCLPLLNMERFKQEVKKMIEGTTNAYETIQPVKIVSML
ncbi:alcohol acyl transferase 1 allele RGa-like [Ziziphus jujuba]|uniref:Alcohol acyl transferase 1 allele RGa-like n=1 Tax=Ziziphus jujuba TaxID=326968 RepID=A0A6P4APL2_ZIZJJ|nr:alcohol acyl transferase 1 allele RGa-like [Ziziphus jujuba]